MENLGLPNLDETEEEEVDDVLQEEEINFKSPIVNEIMKRKKVFENYASSPETTSSFKGTNFPKRKIYEIELSKILHQKRLEDLRVQRVESTLVHT